MKSMFPLAAALASALTVAASAGTLTLSTNPGGGFAVNDPVLVTLSISDLGGGAAAAGFQAFLEYNPSELGFVSASYSAVPFGLPIITAPVLVNPNAGQINLAAGINPQTQSPTLLDADLVTITFTSLVAQCVPTVGFRDLGSNPPPLPTRITDIAGVQILPLNLVSLAPTCDGDTNGDNVVNVTDLTGVIVAWGTSGDCRFDFDLNGTVDVLDLLAVIINWGPCP